MKFLKINWNCNLLLITFSISFLIVLSRTIGLRAFEQLYNFLLSLRIMMDIKTLKYNGQWPKLMHVSAILINFLKYTASLIILLKYFYDNLSGPEVNKLLHFTIKLINSSSKNSFHLIVGLLGISFSKLVLIWWFSTILKDKWKVY